MTRKDLARLTRLDGQLAARSAQAMLSHQAPSGGFLAAVDFAPYRYCWLRDGSFIAFALALAGEQRAAERFHRWVATALSGIAPSMRAATESRLAGEANLAGSMPPARFGPDGDVRDDGWPNFQVDGYGTWLWSLADHVGRYGAGRLLDDLAPSVEMVCAYLEAVGMDPCFDCWEENGGAVHASTLACVYGGLSAASALTGREAARRRADDIAGHIVNRMRLGARFVKSSDHADVDSSLLWLAVPFGVVGADAPVMSATASEIEGTLCLDGGLRRYGSDSYYGGGAWPLLTAWLGWYHLARGDLAGAYRCASCVEGCFDDQGHLAEQVGGEARDPGGYQAWVARWGKPAADLAWSHAMYFVLWDQLNKREVPAPGGELLRRAGGSPEPSQPTT